jgi:hypothetical protein
VGWPVIRWVGKGAVDMAVCGVNASSLISVRGIRSGEGKEDMVGGCLNNHRYPSNHRYYHGVVQDRKSGKMSKLIVQEGLIGV